MNLEVVEERLNPLLGRREVKLLVHHPGLGTPDRITVRKLASDHFKTGIEKVYVRSISTRTGGSAALCSVEVYDETSLAEKIVPQYLKNRNLPPEQRVSRKKGGEEKAAPAEKPPAEKKTRQQPKVEAKAEGGQEAKPPEREKAEQRKEAKALSKPSEKS